GRYRPHLRPHEGDRHAVTSGARARGNLRSDGTGRLGAGTARPVPRPRRAPAHVRRRRAGGGRHAGAVDVAALSQAPPGDDWRWCRHRVLPGGGAGRLSVLRRPRGLRRPARADRSAAGPVLPRRSVQPPRLRDGWRARPGYVQAGLHRGSDPDHPLDLLRPRLRLQAVRGHPGGYAPDRGRRRKSGGNAFPNGDRPGGSRHVVAGDVRHPHLAHDRARRRRRQPGPGRDPRRHLRVLRWLRRHGHSADHRDPPLGPDDPAVDGAGGGDAEDMDGYPGLLRDHDHHFPDRLDRAGAGRSRPVPLAARGGFRDGGRFGRRPPIADHLRPHGAALPEPHHRRDDAGAAGDDHQRDRAELPRSRPAAAGHQLGRVAAAGPERPDGGALAVAAAAGAAGDPRHPRLQLPRRRPPRCRRSVRV
ncbi:MAG: ABC transporter, permease protein 2 (cluster 5, nickel/peptides/opines), partial [uncultured Thermomicrobiales bacterium]